MKKIIFPLIVAIAFLTSCGNTTTKPKSDSAQAIVAPSDSTHSKSQLAGVQYQCPMKCEGEKTYDKAGKCPQCGMEMKEVK